MQVPGLRILLKQTKRNSFGIFVALAIVAILVVLFSPDILQSDLQARAVPANPGEGGANSPDGQAPNDDSKTNSLHELELAKAKLEAQVLSEQLKAEKLKLELEAAVRHGQNPNNNNNKNVAGAPGQLIQGQQAPQNTYQRKQFLRLGTVQEACASPQRIPGAIHTLVPSREGLTYCHVPRTFQAFWLKVYRFINRDFVEDVHNPLDIGTKSAIERPFIRTKPLRWVRVPPMQKTEVLNTKIMLAVENPYERLYNIYVNSFLLPELWHAAGVKIEAKRRSDDLDPNDGNRKKKKLTCGGNVTFEEFLDYALESQEVDYSPVYQLCDACQLNPAYLVKAESLREDSETVLNHFNLAWVVRQNDFQNQTVLRYIRNTVNDNFDLLQRARAMNCGTPAYLGARLWKVFAREGIFPDSGSNRPSIEKETTKEELIQTIVNNYVKYSRTNVNVRVLKVSQMISAYNGVSQNVIERIQRRYIMDFQVLGYSNKVDEIDKETF